MSGMTAMKRITASALPRLTWAVTNMSAYIWRASTSVSKFPLLMVNTMSNTFSVVIITVVSTTTIVLRIIGIWMVRNRVTPEAPSRRADSTISSGIDLSAALRMTMANPVWIQIMMTISRKVFAGMVISQLGGSLQPSLMAIALSRPVCGSDGSL